MPSVEVAGLERARREIIAGQSLTLFPAKVDLSVLLVEDEDVSEVTGSEGRERLEVVAERGACGDVVAADVAHHPMQVLSIIVLETEILKINAIDAIYEMG